MSNNNNQTSSSSQPARIKEFQEYMHQATIDFVTRSFAEGMVKGLSLAETHHTVTIAFMAARDAFLDTSETFKKGKGKQP